MFAKALVGALEDAFFRLLDPNSFIKTDGTVWVRLIENLCEDTPCRESATLLLIRLLCDGRSVKTLDMSLGPH